MGLIDLIMAFNMAIASPSVGNINNYSQRSEEVQYAQVEDTTKQSSPVKDSVSTKRENPSINLPAKSRWKGELNGGIGFREHGRFSIGGLGTHYVEDTLTRQYNPTWSIGGMLLTGRQNPTSGGFSYTGIGGTVGTFLDIGGKKVPVQLTLGGGIYNPENREEGLDVQGFVVPAIGFMYKGIEFKAGAHLQNNQPANILASATAVVF